MPKLRRLPSIVCLTSLVLTGLSSSALVSEAVDPVEAPGLEIEIETRAVAANPTQHEPGGVRFYLPATIASGDPASFYQASSSHALTEHLHLIVDAEGPLPEALLFKKVARAWGLDRTGSRISERLKALLPNTLRQTQEETTTFYWPAATDPSSWSAFRISNESESSRRHINDVCIEEVSALVRHVLQQAGSTPRQDVARAACRLLGRARTASNAEARVFEAIEQLLA